MNNQPMIPETMEQIRQRMAELEQAGQPIAEDDLIYQTIQDLSPWSSRNPRARTRITRAATPSTARPWSC